MDEKTYRIGEAAEMLQLKSYVLRFWQTEFAQLTPLRTDKGQRIYTETHIELLRRIKYLLHEQGMTIEGARRALLHKHNPNTLDDSAPEDTASEDTAPHTRLPNNVLRELRDELLCLQQLLRPSHTLMARQANI